MSLVETYRSLPSDYREHIQNNSNLVMEIVKGCPRSCWFCDEPNKSGVSDYLDRRTINTFTDIWKPGKFIFFYHNSEPTVWKSGKATYKTLAEETIRKGHMLYTNTSIPKGSIDDLIKLEQWISKQEKYDKHLLRISHVQNNSPELYAFREKLATALKQYGEFFIVDDKFGVHTEGKKPEFNLLGIISERFTTYGITLGPKTRKPSSSLNMGDVLGRGDIDTLIFKPQGIEVAITLPNTIISPNGYLRLPFDSKNPILVKPKMFSSWEDSSSITYSSNRQLEFFNVPKLKNSQFIFTARAFWILLSDLNERGVMKLVNTDPELSPHKTTHKWLTEDKPDNCEQPITRKEAAEIKKRLLAEFIPILSNDVFLHPYLNLMVQEMSAIEAGSY